MIVSLKKEGKKEEIKDGGEEICSRLSPTRYFKADMSGKFTLSLFFPPFFPQKRQSCQKVKPP